MGLLVDLAKDVLKQAEQFEHQLEEASHPLPSFEAGTPLMYPLGSQHPELYRTRQAIIDMSSTIHSLALGPADNLLNMCGPENYHIHILNVLEQLDVASHVPINGSITFGKLAAELGVNSEVLERVLRFSFSMHLFQEKPLGSVSHTSVSEALPMLSAWTRFMTQDKMKQAFHVWPEALKLYDEARGAVNLPWNLGRNDPLPFFDTLAAEPGGLGMVKFGRAMESISSANGTTDKSYFLHGFDWSSLGEGPLVDVGGGTGHISVAIADAFPSLHVIIQDLSSNEAAANALIPACMKSRVSFQAHNFFDAQPTGIQPKAYFLRWILHDWSNADCVRILQHLVPSVENGAKILLMERVNVLPSEGYVPGYHETTTLWADLLMWTLLGAKERNEHQWKDLLAKADARLKIHKIDKRVGADLAMIEIGM